MQILKRIINKFNIKKRKNHFKKLILKNRSKNLFNSFFSAILRIIFRSKFLFKILYPFLKRKRNIKEINEFWVIRIGFKRQKNYLPFFNFDYHLSNCIFCCNLKKLPFNDNSCQIIYIKHFFQYFKKRSFNKVIKSFKKKLIPGGTLNIQIKISKNKFKFEKLKQNLMQNNFFIKNIDRNDFQINKTYTITAINQIKINFDKKNKIEDKLKEIFKILYQNKDFFHYNSKILSIGIDPKRMKHFFKQIGLSSQNIFFNNTIQDLLESSEKQFDIVIIADFFEYINFQGYYKIFDKIKELTLENADIFILIPDKLNYISKNIAHLFDKGIFLNILDENNLFLESITLSSSFKMLQTHLKNKPNFPLEKKFLRVLLLGIYSMRYTFLSNARWDSQARAFEKLGYQTKLIDLEDESVNYVLKVIERYNPDILWVGGKDGGTFLKTNADFFRNKKFRIIYWLWDIITPKYFNFKDIIDYMFITSEGEIPLYKKAYNLEKVYYMPVAIMPEILCRNKYIKERYDVGFAGQLSLKNPFYIERTKVVNWFKKHYNLKFIKHIYNYVTEEYLQCKIVYAGDPYFKDLELYASNRPYIALSCGSCIITNYFKGLEKLAVNKKHLLWYDSDEELEDLLDEYLSNDKLREEIRQNAEKLAKEKHNYVARISNILDIIENKTDDFYGFI